MATAKKLHETLWKFVKKLPSDFQPYGERDRAKEWGPDCSCGCRFFAALAGSVGMDWGVCYNEKSPRKGMLTFEHMGCDKFEEEKVQDPFDGRNIKK